MAAQIYKYAFKDRHSPHLCCPSLHSSVGSIQDLRTGGHWFDHQAQPIFFPRIDDSHCDRSHSSQNCPLFQWWLWGKAAFLNLKYLQMINVTQKIVENGENAGYQCWEKKPFENIFENPLPQCFQKAFQKYFQKVFFFFSEVSKVVIVWQSCNNLYSKVLLKIIFRWQKLYMI